ncbi:MAG: PT repeat-containing protein [Candidatus Peregrinibacteria bacterium Gr01-1014_25]|nr:MAG: PT repeat-containing protein [Candidatus Peregrinibacteria bacterium Gr01-1014_25]
MIPPSRTHRQWIARVCGWRIGLYVAFGACIALLWAAGFTSLVRDAGSPTTQQSSPAPLASKAWGLQSLQLSPPLAKRGRPTLAVIIENHEDARALQRGLDDALLILEFIVEGGITRFAAIFDAQHLPPVIGPVRSLRPYVVDALQPWTGLVLHAGGSPEAFEHADRAKHLVAVNTLLGQFAHFTKRTDDPAPHNLVTTDALLTEMLDGRDVPDVRWPPYAIGPVASGSGASAIYANFYSTLHNIDYAYDRVASVYRRTSGGIESAAAPRNVVFLEIPITAVGEHGRLTIPVIGKGRLLLFGAGRVIHGTWKKTATDEPFLFLDQDGSSLRLAAGQTWITALPTLDRVTWRE